MGGGFSVSSSSLSIRVYSYEYGLALAPRETNKLSPPALLIPVPQHETGGDAKKVRFVLREMEESAISPHKGLRDEKGDWEDDGRRQDLRVELGAPALAPNLALCARARREECSDGSNVLV